MNILGNAYRDSLRDERYLPFEFAGAISDWRLELPPDFNYFDVDTISDVVIHMRYTARERGETLREVAVRNVKATLPTKGVQVFDLRRQFASAWQKFIQPGTTSGIQELKLNLQSNLFPFYVRNGIIKVKEVILLAEIENTNAYEVKITPALLPVSGEEVLQDTTLTLRSLQATEELYELYGQLHFARYTAPDTQRGDLGNWTIKIKKQRAADFASLEPDEIQNLVMVILFATVPS